MPPFHTSPLGFLAPRLCACVPVAPRLCLRWPAPPFLRASNHLMRTVTLNGDSPPAPTRSPALQSVRRACLPGVERINQACFSLSWPINLIWDDGTQMLFLQVPFHSVKQIAARMKPKRCRGHVGHDWPGCGCACLAAVWWGMFCRPWCCWACLAVVWFGIIGIRVVALLGSDMVSSDAI